MKKFVAILFVVASLFVFTPAAHADNPPDAQFAIEQCSGLTLVEVISAEQRFDTEIGYEKNLTTQGQWEQSYVWRVNEFAHLVGCPDVLTEEGGWSGTLTKAAKFYVPTFKVVQGVARFMNLGD